MGKLLSNPKIAVALIAVLAVGLVSLAGGALGAAFGGGFLGNPMPHIQLAAEQAFKIGGYSLTNTTIMFWAAGFFLILLVWLATRKMTEIPGRLQCLFEAIVEFFDNTADSVAGGEKAGRRYLPLMLSIFMILLFSNWMGILPGVGSIGWIETPEAWVEHRVHDKEKELEKAAEELGEPAFTPVELHEAALLAVIRENADEKFVVFNGDGLGLIVPGRTESSKVALRQVVDVNSDDVHEIETQLNEGLVLTLNAEQIDDHPDLVGRRAGILVPYLRGASTDLNTTLAVAIVAMFSVQLWGIRALGGRKYLSKFFVSPLKSPILTVVGLLEAFGEIARTISFTFRLFGNMFAGEVLLIVMGFLVPLVGMSLFMGLELFVGSIQAFVFAMLMLVFGVTASAAHGDEHHEEAHAGGNASPEGHAVPQAQQAH